MGNIIQIKHGSGTPTTSNLAEYELGYSTTNRTLYIKDSNGIQKIGTTYNYSDNFPANQSSYTITNDRILSDSVCLIGPDVSATQSQIKAWGAAMVNCSSQSNGRIVLTVNGKIPTTSIPIQLTIL